jgi:indole-3-glycerol phosphate synthase
MNILETIVANKIREVEERRSITPVSRLEKSIHFGSPTISLSNYIVRPDKDGVIAEIKRKSPSKGVINENFSVERLSIGYMQAGASALSILTDEKFFGGRDSDLTTARKFNFCPILRKDFIIDEYQVLESKAIGADAILLISSILEESQLEALARLARGLGLEVLLEITNIEDLPASIDDIAAIGVNSRDLNTFEVDISRAESLSARLPAGKVLIAESGISHATAAKRLLDCGYHGFLIGEGFMRNSQPEAACGEFIAELRRLKYASAAPASVEVA